MKVLDPGHLYQLSFLDGEPQSIGAADVLTFVKRVGAKYPGNQTAHPGTTLQEVMRALIDRVRYLNHQVEDDRNYEVISALREAIWALECRAAERHGRFDAFIVDYELSLIETYPTCPLCLHIGCQGGCHPAA